jgi:hypothetical protein
MGFFWAQAESMPPHNARPNKKTTAKITPLLITASFHRLPSFNFAIPAKMVVEKVAPGAASANL